MAEEIINEIINKENADAESGRKELSQLYKDEKQEAMRSLKTEADDAAQKYHANPYTTKDIVLDIILFFAAVAGAFGWTLLMLLIISFVTLSYLHFEIGKMCIASAIVAAIVAVIYIISKIRKYKKIRK